MFYGPFGLVPGFPDFLLGIYVAAAVHQGYCHGKGNHRISLLRGKTKDAFGKLRVIGGSEAC